MTIWYINTDILPAQESDTFDGGNGVGSLRNTSDDIVWAQGDSVYFACGTTSRRKLTIGASDVLIGAYSTTDNNDLPIISGLITFNPEWVAATNGEYYAVLPANTYGVSAIAVMAFIDGAVLNKRNAVGSLYAGEWQYSAGRIYMKPDGALPGQVSIAYQDEGITNTAGAVTSNVQIQGLEMNGLWIGIKSGITGVEAANNWAIDRVTSRWMSRSHIHLMYGMHCTVRHSLFEYAASTGINFGIHAASIYNYHDVELTDSTLSNGVYWVSDTNLEGHGFDSIEGGNSIVIARNRFIGHGRIGGTAVYPAGGTNMHRAAAVLSLDGNGDVLVHGNHFEGNSVSCVGVGDYSALVPHIPGRNQYIIGNVFYRNQKQFTSTTDANTTNLSTVGAGMSSTSPFSNIVVANNLFKENGCGLRMDAFKPSSFYFAYGLAGAAADLTLANNIFENNNHTDEVSYLNTNATGLVDGSKIRNNLYAPNANPITQYIFLAHTNGSATTYRRVGGTAGTLSWSDYQSLTGADAGSLYQVDPQLNSDFTLRHGSPCIGAGKALDLPILAYDGRPFMTPPSIGAHEYRNRVDRGQVFTRGQR